MHVETVAVADLEVKIVELNDLSGTVVAMAQHPSEKDVDGNAKLIIVWS